MAEARRQGVWKVLLVLITLGIGGSLAACAGIWALLDDQEQLQAGTVLEIVLDGSYTEGPTADPLISLGIGAEDTSLWDLRRALLSAADDDRIAGVLLTIRSPGLGLAQSQELTEALIRYREQSGRPVHALIQTDLVDDGSYYLATGASKIWATPEAWWLVNGLHADVVFWRGTLDKLKVQADVIMFKEHKSAGEPFKNYEMSESMRESLSAVLTDAWDHWLDAVSERRSFDRQRLSELVDEGTITGARALSVGLIDARGYRDEVIAELQPDDGPGDHDPISPSDYLSMLDTPKIEGDRIAVVFGEGPIASGEPDNNPFGGSGMIYGPALASSIREVVEDEHVKAIVFRVNSPGGSAVGSDLVWRELERAQEAGLPVVVSMSSVAGSGGYWIAMGADAIVAQPTTITGSIGVVFTKLNLSGLYELAGANVDSLSLSANSDLLSPYASLSEEQLTAVTQTIEATYLSFVDKVAQGRGMDPQAVEPLAHGRIWSGTDALDNGLIDELGGLDVAVRLAAERAGLGPDPQLAVYPEPKDFLQQLLEGELSVSSQPTPEQLQAWLRELSAPQIQARMPSIELR